MRTHTPTTTTALHYSGWFFIWAFFHSTLEERGGGGWSPSLHLSITLCIFPCTPHNHNTRIHVLEHYWCRLFTAQPKWQKRTPNVTTDSNEHSYMPHTHLHTLLKLPLASIGAQVGTTVVGWWCVFHSADSDISHFTAIDPCGARYGLDRPASARWPQNTTNSTTRHNHHYYCSLVAALFSLL